MYIIYADDIKIFLPFNNIEDQEHIQDDISYLTNVTNAVPI